MNICVLTSWKDKTGEPVGKFYWADSIKVNNDCLKLFFNGEWVRTSTPVKSIELSEYGIKCLTQSGKKYFISTPGAKAMKRLFKSLVAAIS